MRVHYMSDVIAGLAIGFIWLALLLWAIDKLEKHYENRKKI
jgi:membrane-associated phospholipid phosphatase